MGILLMYDVTSLDSFNNLSYWLRNIQEVSGSYTKTSSKEDPEQPKNIAKIKTETLKNSIPECITRRGENTRRKQVRMLSSAESSW